ncbi:tetratricopeptide repeat protein [Paracidovorax citrulli]
MVNALLHSPGTWLRAMAAAMALGAGPLHAADLGGAPANLPAQSPAHSPAHAPAGGMSAIIVDDLYRQAEVAFVDERHGEAAMLLDTLVGMGPVNAGAWLDAAILYCKLYRGEKARALLARIRQEMNPPEAIRRVINLRMEEPCTPAPARPTFTLAASAGHTSNANYAPSVSRVVFSPGSGLPPMELAPDAMARGDGFVNVDLFGEIPVPGSAYWSINGTFSTRQYRSMSGYDSTLAAAGATYRTPLWAGHFEQRASVGQYWLGGRPYQRYLSLQTGYWFNRVQLMNKRVRFGADVALADQRYDSNPLYNTHRIELRAKAEFQPSPYVNVLLLGGPIWERPMNDRPGGARSGYTVLAGANVLVWGQHSVSMLVQQQTMRESDPYFPGLFGDVVRRQTSRQWTVRYTVPVRRDLELYGQFTRQTVKDAIPLFSYQVSTGSIGLAYSY